ncbi:MAG: hypothetical protein ACLU8S_03110 [Coprococcus phoceensis]
MQRITQCEDSDRIIRRICSCCNNISLDNNSGISLAGQSVGFALARGISVLVISCPCALGLYLFIAIMVSNGMGAQKRHDV